MWDDGEGLSHGSFTIPVAQAAMLRKALFGFAAPKHVRATEGAGGYDHERPTAHKLGLAFMEYIERYPTDLIPTMGGLAATVVVTPQPTPSPPVPRQPAPPIPGCGSHQDNCCGGRARRG